MAKKPGGRGSAAAQDKEALYIETLRNKAQAYLRSPNITSVGVGYREKDGQPTDELTIQFTVERKLGPETLAAEQIPLLPTTIVADDGTVIPVDVVERSYRPTYSIVTKIRGGARAEAEELSAYELRRRRLATIQPGISVGRRAGKTGTFGAVVYDDLTGTPYVLSNWHVLHSAGSLGDDVVQPGQNDDGSVEQNVMGRLERSHLGVAGDCAIGTIVGRGVDPKILELGVVPRRAARANLGDKVVKSGRTTGVTYGVVKRVGVVVNMTYDDFPGVHEVGGFEIAVNPDKEPGDGEISMGGDSGSLWMVDTQGPDRDVAVGLHFGGETDPNPAREHAMACNIHSVLEKLKVSFEQPGSAPQAADAVAPPRRTASRRRAAKRPK